MNQNELRRIFAWLEAGRGQWGQGETLQDHQSRVMVAVVRDHSAVPEPAEKCIKQVLVIKD